MKPILNTLFLVWWLVLTGPQGQSGLIAFPDLSSCTRASWSLPSGWTGKCEVG